MHSSHFDVYNAEKGVLVAIIVFKKPNYSADNEKHVVCHMHTLHSNVQNDFSRVVCEGFWLGQSMIHDHCHYNSLFPQNLN